MHVRFTLLAGDPARLPDAVRFVEDKARPQVEGEEGNRGMALYENAELGVAVTESFWVSGDALRESERTVGSIREQAAKLALATASVERYQVGLFVRAARPHPGGGVRLTRFDTEPGRVDDAVAAFEDVAVPWLTETDGFCEAMMFVDRRTGRSIGETLWRDANALATSRGASAAIRLDTVAASESIVRAVEEYRLVFTSLRRD